MNTPAGWRSVSLGDIARVYSGGTPSRSVAAYWGGGIPWASTAEIAVRSIMSTKETISELGLVNSAAKIAPAGTLLMAMYGQGKTRGKTSMLGIDAAMNQACAAIQPHAGIDPQFLLAYLRHNYEMIRALSNAGGQENLSGEIVKKIPVVLPDMNEQIRIAEASQAAARLIDCLERLIAKKQAIKQGMMQQLLTGKTRLPGFTAEWAKSALGAVATVNMGQAPAGSSYNTAGRGTPLIQGNADIRHRRTIDRVWTTQPTKHCRAGDVVLTVRAPVGFTAIASKDSCLGRGVCSISTQNDNRFLYHALVYAEPSWSVYEQGSTFTAVSSTEVRSFILPWPTDQIERRAIAAALDDADSETAVLSQRIAKAKAMKQGMMQELLTGRTRSAVRETVS